MKKNIIITILAIIIVSIAFSFVAKKGATKKEYCEISVTQKVFSTKFKLFVDFGERDN